MTERYAIYFAPARGSALWRFGTGWLGRDPEAGVQVPARYGLPEKLHRDVTAAPARYGFHATLKPPFRLADGVGADDLRAALTAFARGRSTFVVPRLSLVVLDGFLALVPADPCALLADLARECVTEFDSFRAQLTDEETARRWPEHLTPAQRENLARWGYPYVLDEFRFHMTLTGRLEADTLERVRSVLEAATAGIANAPMPAGGIALYCEPAPGAAFDLIERFEFAADG